MVKKEDRYARFTHFNEALALQGLDRSVPTWTHGQKAGQKERILDFSSNDYLNFREAPLIRAHLKSCLEKGVALGAGGSPLIQASKEYIELCTQLERWMGYPRALVFSSGYGANLGWMEALIQPSDLVIADRLIHASLIDGIKASGASFRRFLHNDPESLETLLNTHAPRTPEGLTWVVTESLFSMDGDAAPLKKIAQLVKESGALWAVDESHAIGVRGSGRGLCAELGLKPDVLMFGFGKALGAMGAAVLTEAPLYQTMLQKARPLVYSTALSPLICEAVLKAMEEIQAHPELGVSLLSKAAMLRRALDLGEDAQSPIIPYLVGGEEQALRLAEALSSEFRISAIRPPTVPKGSSRLRITLTHAHDQHAVLHLASVLLRTHQNLLDPTLKNRPELILKQCRIKPGEKKRSAFVFVGGWGSYTDTWLLLKEAMFRNKNLKGDFEEYAWWRLMGDVSPLCEALRQAHENYEKVILIAHSLGGLIALHALLKLKKTLPRLKVILVGTTARLPMDEGYPGVPRLMLSSLSKLLGFSKEGLTLRFIADSIGKTNPNRVYLYQDFLKHQTTDLQRGLDFLSGQDLRERLSEIAESGRFWVIHGGKDGIIPSSQGRYLAQNLKAAWCLVPEGAHALQYGHEEEIASLIELALKGDE